MATTRSLLILMFLAISFGGVRNATLQLPLTINPLLQNVIKMGSYSQALFAGDPTFYSKVTLSDIVKKLEYKSSIQATKSIEALVILALAAEVHGLTLQEFEFLETSRWSINMSTQEIANASEKFTLPLNDSVSLIAIQEAMFKVLEGKFQFKTGEVAEKFNKTVDEIYSALEPGWIDTVHFITEKNVLRLSQTYDIPPFYIAESLNMSLVELYNSTLPELEDILTNKLEIIKEAAKRLRKTSTTAYPAMTTLWATSNVTWSVNRTMGTMNSTTSTVNNTTPTMIMEKTKKSIEGSTYTKVMAMNETMYGITIGSTSPITSSTPPYSKLHASPYSTTHTYSSVTQIMNKNISQASKAPQYHSSSMYPTPITNTTATLGSVVTRSTTSQPLGQSSSSPSIEARLSLVSTYIQNTYTDHRTYQSSLFSGAFSNSNSVKPRRSAIFSYSSTMLDSLFPTSSTNFTSIQRPTLTSTSREVPIMASSAYQSSAMKNTKTTDIKQSVTVYNDSMTIIAASFLKTSFVLATSSNPVTGKISSSSTTKISSLKMSSNPEPTQMLQSSSPTLIVVSTNGSTEFSGSSSIASWKSSRTGPSSSKTSPKQEPTTSLFPTSVLQESSRVSFASSYPLVHSSSLVYEASPISASWNRATTRLSQSMITSEYKPATLTYRSGLMESSSFVPSRSHHTTSSSSSIVQSVDSCNSSSCKADQVCILNSGRSTCKDAQNLQGNFRITGGATFSQELTNPSSERFRNLSRQITELIDSVYQKSNSFSSSYLGCEVINFTQGSIIVFYKLSFGKDLTMSSDAVEKIEQTLVTGLGENAQHNFQIDTKSTSIQDYDECSTGRMTECYVCKNTLGSYTCICPEGMTGDGRRCEDVNNSSRSVSKDDFDPVLYIVVPITAFLVLLAVIVGILLWWTKRRTTARNKQKGVETGSELSTKNLVESLENINKSRTSDFVNNGAEDRPSRSMSRTSSISNLETIHEANEPDDPEIYDL